ncbi:MAG: caspase family protein, partial [Bacteroidota bacterium]
MRIKTTFLLVVSFIFSVTILSAQCVSGDCTNGEGIFKYTSGAKYVGEFVNGEIHGQGICYYSDGSKYEGQWRYRYPEGQGTKTYADKSTWTGRWKKGQPIDENGALVKEQFIGKGGMFSDGMEIQSGCIYGDCKNGQGTFAYKDGSKYEGQFLNGAMHGQGVWYLANGDKYVGTFHNNYADGKGVLHQKEKEPIRGIWKSGELVDSEFVEKGRTGCVSGNCIDGQGIYIFKDGHAQYRGRFAGGQPHGRGTCNFANGDRYTGEWSTGRFHGVGTLHMANGHAANGIWSNGKFIRANTNTPRVSSRPEKVIPDAPTRPTDPSIKPKVWAMIVGVADYSQSSHMTPLKYTDDDAYRMLAFLKSPEGGALEDEQIRILVDEAATKQRILDDMKDIFSKAGENDLVMMYFSGHGLYGSFLPIDFDSYNNKLYHEEINEIFKNSRAKYKLCIADACHSGSLFTAKGSTSTQNMLSTYYQTLAQADAGT